MDLHATRVVSCRIGKRIYVVCVHSTMSTEIPAALLEETTDVHISVPLSVVNFLSDCTSSLYHVAIFLSSRLCRSLESLPSVETRPMLLLHLLLMHRMTRVGLPHISHGVLSCNHVRHASHIHHCH